MLTTQDVHETTYKIARIACRKKKNAMTGVQPSKELLVELLQRKFMLESFHFDYISGPRNVVKLGTQMRNMSAHLTARLFFGEVDIESDSFVALKNRHCRRY